MFLGCSEKDENNTLFADIMVFIPRNFFEVKNGERGTSLSEKKTEKNGQFLLVLPPSPKIFNPTFVSKSIKVPTLLVYD